ncbi:lipase family protein [Phreatobacter stygius]|uniref:Thioesterase domain-containing protein n=1 Tax=Phreatobacter stygius TaxID=1940610 RepID=A0A4D7AWC6_9HYPH|nr:lipase family protein [Phreatobacter stygius]QCI64261.1 hypothetical protein E8M01_08400 [Phreatobacter stygius]
MRLYPPLVVALCCGLGLGLAGCQTLEPAGEAAAPAQMAGRGQPQPAVAPAAPVRVYLFRGLFDVFSLGIDNLGGKLRRKGYAARTMGVASWEAVAAEIVQRRRADPGEQIVVIGHSLGADAAVRIANRVAREGLAPLALVVTFDPVSRQEVHGGTRRLVNLFQSNNGWAVPLSRGPGFTGRFVNEDLRDRGGVNHLTIDKDRRLHDEIIGWIDEAAAEGRRPGPDASALSRPAAPAAPRR